MDEETAFAVIFTSRRRDGTAESAAAYDAAADRMVELARTQTGFLGIDSVRSPDGVGVTVSYWDSEASLSAWRDHPEHAATRELGRREWYEWYDLRVALVTRRYGFGDRPPT